MNANKILEFPEKKNFWKIIYYVPTDKLNSTQK